MIRNLPKRFTQEQLTQELEGIGLGGMFDFVYLPTQRGSRLSVGYAFVNFVDATCAEKCLVALQYYRFTASRKIIEVSVAHVQGLEANMARFQQEALPTAQGH